MSPRKRETQNTYNDFKETAMTQHTSKSTGLTVRTALKAGAVRPGAGRADQPDRPNRRTHTAARRLAASQFGINAQGVPTFTRS